MNYQLYLGDCLQIMPTLPAHSVDLICTDPPYFGIVGDDWDNQWEKLEDYTAWIDALAIEWRRILKPNGSIYVFQDDKVCAYVQVTLDKRFLLLNNITWNKTNNFASTYSENNRCYTTTSERILFYSAQYDPTGWETIKLDMNNFMPLREYFRQYQEAIGLNIKQINSALGHRKAEHAFYWGSTQWDLPTPETYAELERLPLKNSEFVRREYEDLRREYEDLRRTFNADSKTLDVITGPIVSGSDNTDHPTTKPLWLMRRLITVSTNPGMTVLDCCSGSGATGVAAMQTGRNFIGIEKERKYFDIGKRRIELAAAQPLLPGM